ncbi:MAG: hypothetical protein Q8P45_03185 [Candidatus Harrisonbacteria bacterium]|nr:hypothetical protein [Candidatus Harrisonbacteria bacterium]
MLSMGLDGKSARVWILSVLQGEPLFSGGKLNMEYDQFGVLTERMLGYHVEDVEIFYLYHFSRENNPCSPDD